MDVATARWLTSPAGAAVLDLATAATADHPDPLAASAALRRARPGLPPEQAAGALEQADLARLAADRYGLTGRTWLTRDGLEQGTRPPVADRRAADLVRAGARRVLDLTAGLGFDARAFARLGLDVVAVERDPVVATLLAANVPAATVLCADAADALRTHLPDLAPTDVVFVDPARRDPTGPRDRGTARARPERDPERWSPPWSWVAAIAHPRVCAKVAPAFDPPPGWHGQWTSWHRTVVEAQVASWPLSGADRRAVVLAADQAVVVDADPGAVLTYLPTEETPAVLVDPDPAVVRAGAVSRLASDLGLRGLDPRSSWLVGTTGTSSPALRGFAVVAELTGSSRERRRQLAALGVERAVVKSRDARADPAHVRRELGLREGGDHVLVLTQRAGRTVAYLTTPMPRD